ncbi:MAG: hypothetical protein OXU67_09800 [Chloroflexota bacterium]|nr:hypothetical protein [Chloroflexota bacterium]
MGAAAVVAFLLLFAGIANAEGEAELSGYSGGYERLSRDSADWPTHVANWQSTVGKKYQWDLKNRTSWNQNLSTLIEDPDLAKLEAVLSEPDVWNREFAVTLSDSSKWSENLERELVLNHDVIRDLMKTKDILPLAWVHGCGTVYGINSTDRDHLSRICRVIGDVDSIENAMAVGSKLGILLSKEASQVMTSDQELKRLYAAHVAQGYMREWMDITKEDTASVYFFDDSNSLILEGISELR